MLQLCLWMAMGYLLGYLMGCTTIGGLSPMQLRNWRAPFGVLLADLVVVSACMRLAYLFITADSTSPIGGQHLLPFTAAILAGPVRQRWMTRHQKA